MTNKSKYLAKNIFLFFLASFLPKMMSFFMVPLYTSCLTTAEYGIADVLFNTVQLVAPILTFQVQDAILRFSMDRERNPKQVLSIGMEKTMKGSLILGCTLIIIRWLGLFNLTNGYALYILCSYTLMSVYSILSYYCRGMDRVCLVTIASSLMTVMTVVTNLVLLLKLNLGLLGYLIANTVGYIFAIGFVIIAGKIYKDLVFQIDSQLRQEMINFSVPMIFSALSWWVNNASDKYVLTYFGGVSVVGIYAISSKIPTILQTIGMVISRAFSISAIKDFDAEDQDGFLGKSYEIISFGMAMGCSTLILFNIPLAKILFSGDFFAAWRYVPWLLMAAMFNQLSLTCENLFLAVKNTKVISQTAIMAAILNTGLNFALIPIFGAYGAAIATVAGFGTEWIIRYAKLKKHIVLRHNFKNELFTYAVLVMQIFFSYFGYRSIIWQCFCFTGIIIINKSNFTLFFNIVKQLVLRRK